MSYPIVVDAGGAAVTTGQTHGNVSGSTSGFGHTALGVAGGGPGASFTLNGGDGVSGGGGGGRGAMGPAASARLAAAVATGSARPRWMSGPAGVAAAPEGTPATPPRRMAATAVRSKP